MSFLKRISYENKRLLCLSFLLFIPILLDFIKVLTRGDSYSYTYAVYIGSLFYILYIFRKDVTIGTIGFLFLFYSLFAISYLLFPETREYYSSNEFIMLCVYFLPIISLVVRNIRGWNNFFRIMSWFGIAAVLMGLYIVFFSGIDLYSKDERYFTYMEFSYALLPFVCSLYIYAKENKPLVYYSFFALGLIEMLAFGSRATVLFALLFIIFSELVNRISNVRSLLFFGILIGFLAFNFNILIDALASIPTLGDSYIMKHLVSGELFEHDTRKIIYENCVRRIDSMGFDVGGFFGDRKDCGSVYPHNIVYEIMMQWGWFLGPIIIGYFLLLILKSIKNSSNKVFIIFILCSLLGRYFVSGTYVIEGNFWIFYGCLLALSQHRVFQIKK